MADAGAREPANSALILVVEDEEPIRFMVTDGLHSFDYSTLEAETAAEALELLEHNPIDLAFIDVGIPGDMDGAELAFAIQERWPVVEIVVGSGNFDPKSARLPKGASFIGKPYRLHSLNAIITRHLSRKRPVE